MPLNVSSTCAHHQEVKIALHSLWYHHTYRWPGLIVKQKFCTSSWLITEIIYCHSNANLLKTLGISPLCVPQFSTMYDVLILWSHNNHQLSRGSLKRWHFSHFFGIARSFSLSQDRLRCRVKSIRPLTSMTLVNKLSPRSRCDMAHIWASIIFQ